METPAKKKGKSKTIYGVIQSRWYSQKVSKTSIEALKLSGQLETAEEREELFNLHRDAIQHIIKKAEAVSDVLGGFYEDPRHLEGQFHYVTGGTISGVIKNSLAGHLGLLFILGLD